MTNDNPTVALMLAVDVLTERHPVVVDDPKTRKVLGVRDENALLMKLRAAKASNVGKTGGAGSAGQERTPLNVGATDLYDGIVSEITALSLSEANHERRAGAVPEALLRGWMVQYLNRWRANQIPRAAFGAQIARMLGWATAIRDVLDPPHRYPLDRPCPRCGEHWADLFDPEHPDDVERVLVLDVVERENPEESFIVCRSCSAVWAGVREIRILGIALDAGQEPPAERDPARDPERRVLAVLDGEELLLRRIARGVKRLRPAGLEMSGQTGVLLASVVGLRGVKPSDVDGGLLFGVPIVVNEALPPARVVLITPSGSATSLAHVANRVP